MLPSDALRRTIFASAALLGAMTGVATASEGVRCVQAELSALGYEPGPIDGAMGRRTASAFAALAARSATELAAFSTGALDAGTAGAWCRDLATAFPELAPVYEEYRQAVGDEDRSSGFRYDIAADVPPARVEEIKEGFRLVRDFIADELGGDIPADVRADITVKIVATGRGNEERGGGGAAATALAAGHPVARLFFDVAHVEWSQNTTDWGWPPATDNAKVAAHEYTHAWQSNLGGMTFYEQELGNWMNEGIAEYIAYRSVSRAGRLDWEDAMAFMIRASRGPETDHPLEAFGTTRSPAWAGHVGFLAIDWLVSESPGGLMALRIAATEVSQGRSQAQAFRAAFGLELKDFYQQFEVWRGVIRSNPNNAVAMRPKLRIADASVDAADLVRATPAFSNPLEEAQALLDYNGRPMQLPGDTELTAAQLAGMLVGRKGTMHYTETNKGVITFGRDGGYSFAFNGETRVIGTYVVSSDGWVCSITGNRPENCVRYVMAGGDLHRLNQSDGRMPMEVQ